MPIEKGPHETYPIQGSIMNARMAKKIIHRIEPRIPTEMFINCRPFASCHIGRSSDGIMRNYSGGGLYIETSREVMAGTTLIVRIIGFPSKWSPTASKEGPRTICLAEVRWQKKLSGGHIVRYGMGLRRL